MLFGADLASTRNRPPAYSAIPKSVLALSLSLTKNGPRTNRWPRSERFLNSFAPISYQPLNAFSAAIGYPYLASKGNVSSVTSILSRSLIREAHSSSGRNRTNPV